MSFCRKLKFSKSHILQADVLNTFDISNFDIL